MNSTGGSVKYSASRVKRSSQKLTILCAPNAKLAVEIAERKLAGGAFLPPVSVCLLRIFFQHCGYY